MNNTQYPTAHRLQWHDLPSTLRSHIEGRLGSHVVAVQSQDNGFTHGLATILTLEDGQRVFAKGISEDDLLAPAYRTESTHASELSSLSFVPRHLGMIEHGSWLILLFEAIDGRHPDPADNADVDLMCTALSQISAQLTPTPVAVPTVAEALGPLLNRWRASAWNGPPTDLEGWAKRHLATLAELEGHWPAAATGTTLVHRDIRADNLLIRPDGAVFVIDWAGPCAGASWIDFVLLAVSIMASGNDAAALHVENHPILQLGPAERIDSFLCAVAGHWTLSCRQPPPARSPNLRSHQRRQSRAALSWLERRINP